MNSCRSTVEGRRASIGDRDKESVCYTGTSTSDARRPVSASIGQGRSHGSRGQVDKSPFPARRSVAEEEERKEKRKKNKKKEKKRKRRKRKGKKETRRRPRARGREMDGDEEGVTEKEIRVPLAPIRGREAPRSDPEDASNDLADRVSHFSPNALPGCDCSGIPAVNRKQRESALIYATCRS